ncbi:DUF4291 domain-containing protein [Elizabethkingia anophelis]|uniref:DUF4291 domain-containing protein n=1 Tax=Elizabethkingia anophelis TaxID=1117645 RepID=UPI001D26FE79|nr:DUF4291 domain-containing protein [Elizabethkingia anophelis]EHM7983024.1 DUF4291 domain-containing protein [Elizabethkingia anophelis]EHM8030246.1 DUF4291 domain-containing protein [Elizabethkingia anophelis]EHZ9533000.1 DUF4291 domain-containing protein [Elizabethkingia anophelis]EKU3670910.1 DUF4291 domain-containing protein [Elizabethkingia anophelis]EKW9476279.1 DUF4291 domain-containing protein [Elizabethkingia anophelis]
MNDKTIRALYDNDYIIIYQAFNKYIAQSAVDNQSFISPPFKKERMTWIKPSFLWMMYRSGWATKENQENILAIKIKRSGFEWALQNSCLSHFDSTIHSSYDSWKETLKNSPVRIQWDPEKDIFLQPLNYRSIQIGLSGIAVEKYISNWIIDIEDITEHCKKINLLIKNNKINQAKEMLPKEQLYPLPENIALQINSY